MSPRAKSETAAVCPHWYCAHPTAPEQPCPCHPPSGSDHGLTVIAWGVIVVMTGLAWWGVALGLWWLYGW